MLVRNSQRKRGEVAQHGEASRMTYHDDRVVIAPYTGADRCRASATRNLFRDNANTTTMETHSEPASAPEMLVPMGCDRMQPGEGG